MQAPLEVVCVLKALAEEGQLTLGDGRRLQAGTMAGSPTTTSGPASVDGERSQDASSALVGEVVPVAPGFRMIVLANPPGWPFQGNDFFRECGDVFSAHAVSNPDATSQACGHQRKGSRWCCVSLRHASRTCLLVGGATIRNNS